MTANVREIFMSSSQRMNCGVQELNEGGWSQEEKYGSIYRRRHDVMDLQRERNYDEVTGR